MGHCMGIARFSRYREMLQHIIWVLGYDTWNVHVPTPQVKMSWSSMNHGDSFILDLWTKLWVWQGETTGEIEKIKALEVALRIRDEERGSGTKLCPIGAWVGG